MPARATTWKPIRVPRADGRMVKLSPSQTLLYSVLPSWPFSPMLALWLGIPHMQTEIEKELIAMYRLGVIGYRRYTPEITSCSQCIWYQASRGP